MDSSSSDLPQPEDPPLGIAGQVDSEPETERPVDLDRIAADLADVELAMERIESAKYWTDEVTGESLADDFLAEHPTARRAGGSVPPLPPPADTPAP